MARPSVTRAGRRARRVVAAGARRTAAAARRQLAVAVLVVIGLGLLALHVSVRLTAWDNPLRERTVDVRGDGRHLIVLLHGYGPSPQHFPRFRQVVERTVPGADIFAPRYDASVFSNARPENVADEVRVALGDLQATRRYATITLVGHSMGALLLRKAYIDDLEQRGSQGWADRVDRILLLGGMNRGWSLSPRPRNMTRAWQATLATLTWIGRLSGTGRLIRDVERGAPFVGDLRIQWLRAVETAVHGDVRLAPVFQMLGVIDDLVDREDNMDVAAASGFTFVDVSGGHLDAIKLDEGEGADNRRRTFTRLLTEDPTGLQAELAPRQPLIRPSPVQHVVMILHGIRDDGEWTAALAEAIQARARAAGQDVRVLTPKYGYFPMGSFLVSPWRGEHVRWFVDRYVEELATAIGRRHTVKVSVFAHSNGTYLVGKGLLDYPRLTFENVVFAGTVMPRTFPWDRFIDPGHGRVRRFRNDRGAADLVVALFPNVFEYGARALGVRTGWLSELGGAGFHGFAAASANAREPVLPGGHGGADTGGLLSRSNFESVARFLIDGTDAPAPARALSPWIDFWSRLCWIVWALLVGGALGLGHAAGRLLPPLVARVWRRRPSYAAVWIAYAALLLAVLQSV